MTRAFLASTLCPETIRAGKCFDRGCVRHSSRQHVADRGQCFFIAAFLLPVLIFPFLFVFRLIKHLREGMSFRQITFMREETQN